MILIKKDNSPHDRVWQLQEAKNHLSQLLDSALQNGPQTITLRGNPAAAIVSFEKFRKLAQPRSSLSQFFNQSPLSNMELDLGRSATFSREVDL